MNKDEHKKLRPTYLEGLAEAWESEGKGSKSAKLKNLIATEEQRELFRKLRRITKGTENLSTTMVKVKNEEGNEREITEKEGMENVIRDENRKKYHQTENTCPFLIPPLVNDFGMYGEGPKTEEVFKGTYKIPEGVDKYTRGFIKACKFIDKDSETELARSPKTYLESWKKMDEKNTSRRLHFGHFKAACNHNKNILLHYALAEIPFRTGFSPLRWQQATNVMI